MNGWSSITCQRDSVLFETWGKKNPAVILYFGKGTLAVSDVLVLLLKVRYRSWV